MERISFIGFGEAAFHIAKGLHDESFPIMNAFDEAQNSKERGEIIRTRAECVGVQLVESMQDACMTSDIIISLTNARVAFNVAHSVIPLLKKGQIYVDMNSASPKTKIAIDSINRQDGVLICDAAIMGTVPGTNHRTPMLLAGSGAQEFCDYMTPYGMVLTVLNSTAGSASAIKLLKSIIMKGLPQLMFESFEAAEKYGVLEILIDSLNSSLSGKNVEQLADVLMARTMIHANRRREEMRDVLDMLEDIKIDATMTKAIINRLDKMAAENWQSTLGANGGEKGFQEVIEVITKQHNT